MMPLMRNLINGNSFDINTLPMYVQVIHWITQDQADQLVKEWHEIHDKKPNVVDSGEVDVAQAS